MLANLVVNAVEASPIGGTISLALTREGGQARIVLRNQGAVPECVRERFFEKYATAGKTRGTGLGTYSARLIARAHDVREGVLYFLDFEAEHGQPGGERLGRARIGRKFAKPGET